MITGEELITITIERQQNVGTKRLSTRYSMMSADRFRGTKGEFHLMHINMLIDRWNRQETKEFNFLGGENE
jgi:hypothetical protein